LSWRRFLVLLRGLSPGSATVAAIHNRVELGARPESDVGAIQDPKEAELVFDRLFASRK
jgi:hypothetical protein